MGGDSPHINDTDYKKNNSNDLEAKIVKLESELARLRSELNK